MLTRSLSLAIQSRVQQAANLPPNRLTEEDTTMYLTEEDSNEILIEED